MGGGGGAQQPIETGPNPVIPNGPIPPRPGMFSPPQYLFQPGYNPQPMQFSSQFNPYAATAGINPFAQTFRQSQQPGQSGMFGNVPDPFGYGGALNAPYHPPQVGQYGQPAAHAPMQNLSQGGVANSLLPLFMNRFNG